MLTPQLGRSRTISAQSVASERLGIVIPGTITILYKGEMLGPGVIIGVERIGSEQIEASIPLPHKETFSLSALCF